VPELLSPSQPRAQERAKGALEVAVLDHEWTLGRAAEVILLGDERRRRRAEVPHAAGTTSRPSKIRFAPGSSAGEAAR
jgi:hypothetical protein